MTSADGPVYEVTFSVENAVREFLDEWLATYVADRLALPGFLSADTRTVDDDERTQRVVRFEIESAEDLAGYLDQAPMEGDEDYAKLAGTGVSTTRRVLMPENTATQAVAEVVHCLNCDARMSGQYCGQCGQRSGRRLISLWELIRDAFGDLFEFDSRLWRTLIPLTVRPGLLTQDYLLGRRARYMPPFRMYIVLSLAFFLLAFFDPRSSLGLLFPDEPVATTTAAVDALSGDTEALAPTGDSDSDSDGAFSFTIDGETERFSCEFPDFDTSDMPPWLADRLTVERVEAACRRILTPDGKGLTSFFSRMIDGIPVGLFVLLPAMALALKILYPLSRRFYVEHLLFVLHFHAFVFLALTVQVLLSRVLALVRLPEALATIAGLAVGIYIPVYLFKAQRRVYGQGKLATLPKWLLLLFGYLSGVSFIFLVAIFFAAASA